MFAFTALRKGHWIMFIVGFLLPIFWIIGALVPPVRRISPPGRVAPLSVR